jgi:hypothetical protein
MRDLCDMGTMDPGHDLKGMIALPAPVSGAAPAPAETTDGMAADRVPPGRAVVAVSAAPEPAPPVEPAAASRKESPAMPRAATLAPALEAEPPPPPETAPADPATADAEAPTATAPLLAAAAARQARGKFGLLAACVAVAACAGAVAGSFGTGALERAFGTTPVAAAPADPGDDIRSLKEAVTQLRTSVKTLGDSLATLRTSITAANASTTDKLAKVSEVLDRVERGQAERRAAATPAPAAGPDITGSLPPAPAAEPPGRSGIVDGWTLRRVMGGVAMVEGRYGIVEVEPGDTVPGVGRVRDIRRQDGRWVVVTPKGMIVQR